MQDRIPNHYSTQTVFNRLLKCNHHSSSRVPNYTCTALPHLYCLTQPHLYRLTQPHMYCRSTRPHLYCLTQPHLYCLTQPHLYCLTQPHLYCLTQPHLYCLSTVSDTVLPESFPEIPARWARQHSLAIMHSTLTQLFTTPAAQSVVPPLMDDASPADDTVPGWLLV